MLLYKCTSCQEFIQVSKARLTCTTCASPINLCANCYVVQEYPLQHPDGSSHSILVYQHSGYLPIPPPPPVRTHSVGSTYASAPPRRRPVSAFDASVPPKKPPRPTKPEVRSEPDAGETVSEPAPSQLPTSLPPEPQQQSPQQDSYTQQHGPPPKPPQRPQNQQTTPSQHPQHPQRESIQPPQAQQYQLQHQYQQEPQYQQPQQQEQHQSSGWTSFFNQDMTPTPCFYTLINELFYHLDPHRTGLLSPETYSEYIDACGAPANHNIWKASRAKTPLHGYDIADRELADHFTSYSVDFVLKPRKPPSTPTASPLNHLSYLPASQRAMMERFMPPGAATPSVSGNQKPMLSHQGWTDLTICGVLLNPSAAWGQLNRAMRHFHLPLWASWGDIPRDMLPLAPHQPEVERVQVMMEGARINAEREMDSLQARLLLEKKGRQQALDLLDDRVYVYR